MSEVRKVIIRVLKEAGEELGPSEIAAAGGLKENVVKQRLMKLVSDGDVTEARSRSLRASRDPRNLRNLVTLRRPKLRSYERLFGIRPNA